MNTKSLIALVVIVVLGAGGVSLHAAIAGPVRGPELTAETAAPTPEAAAAAETEPGAAPAQDAPAADADAVPADMPVPEPDPRFPLARDIPGCVCHSDDPKLVESHADYRMNQCAGCHGGETPTGQ